MSRWARNTLAAVLALGSVLLAANLAVLALILFVLIGGIVAAVRFTDWLLSKLQKG